MCKACFTHSFSYMFIFCSRDEMKIIVHSRIVCGYQPLLLNQFNNSHKSLPIALLYHLKISIFALFRLVILERRQHFFVFRTETRLKIQAFQEGKKSYRQTISITVICGLYSICINCDLLHYPIGPRRVTLPKKHIKLILLT